MDLYICGAVPPYSFLLGSKLVACLATAREIGDAFREKYAGATGIISGEAKPAELLVITTTSALGRSSLYNRLKLRTLPSSPNSSGSDSRKAGGTSQSVMTCS